MVRIRRTTKRGRQRAAEREEILRIAAARAVRVYGMDFHDAMQDGHLIMNKAIATYDSSKGASFKTWALLLIRNGLSNIAQMHKKNIFTSEEPPESAVASVAYEPERITALLESLHRLSEDGKMMVELALTSYDLVYKESAVPGQHGLPGAIKCVARRQFGWCRSRAAKAMKEIQQALREGL